MNYKRDRDELDAPARPQVRSNENMRVWQLKINQWVMKKGAVMRPLTHCLRVIARRHHHPLHNSQWWRCPTGSSPTAFCR